MAEATPGSQALPWTELNEDGALYNTSLKKVRYRSHTLEDLGEGDHCSFKQWETIKIKQMKAGTLDKLIEHLTLSVNECSESDPGFLLAFLCTYKSFTSTDQVVELLLKRFEFHENSHASPECDQEAAQAILKGIISVISIWIDRYPRDFDEPPEYLNLTKLINFSMKRKRHMPHLKELFTRCENKLRTLTVSPYDDEKPFKFKFCSCVSVIGCTCENPDDKKKKPLEIKDFTDEFIAEQLTLTDSELFLRVVPRESLSHFWSKRDSSKGSKAQSIKLTVDQFNAVSLKVISTILNARDGKSKQFSALARSKVMSTWIEVALELRELKNFSSLKAIISAFGSSAVYRLASSWELVPKFAKETYEELSEIFSTDSNQKASRDLLVQEGTAKYSTNSMRRSKSKRQSLIKEGKTNGTVPYLGTFLTDLTMIDSALPDIVKGNLINFEKRRKEFEVVVQIKLLQQAAKNYDILPSKTFFAWFNSIETYSDKDGYERSLEVDPPPPKNNSLSKLSLIKKPTTPQPAKKPKSLKKYLSESDLIHQVDGTASPTSSIDRKMSDPLMTDSLYSLVTRSNLKAESLSSRTSLGPNDAVTLDRTGVVARVYLEDATCVKYKAIKIFPNDKAIDVIAITLHKFTCEASPILYSLYQAIDNKKSLHLPANSNMFYAMHKCKELCFKVSRKKLSKKSKKKAEAMTSLGLKSPEASSVKPRFSYQVSTDAVDGPVSGITLKSFSPL